MPARTALRAIVYRAFYRMPHGMRVKLVRLLVSKYIVGAVVFTRDAEAAEPGRLLLLRQPPGRGWTLPAGLLRKGEEPVLGALRELAEETGIRLTREQIRPAVPNAVVHAKGWIDMVFEATVPASRTTLAVDGAEVWEAAWHPLDDLPPLTLPTARLLGYYGMGPLAGEENPLAADRDAMIAGRETTVANQETAAPDQEAPAGGTEPRAEGRPHAGGQPA